MNEYKSCYIGWEKPTNTGGDYPYITKPYQFIPVKEKEFNFPELEEIIKRAESKQGTEGMKNDYLDDKLRWDLLPMAEVEKVVKILSFGAKKYAPNNWQNVDNGIERYYAALMRHIVAWRKGETVDPDSNCEHLAHAVCNLIFLLYLTNDKEK